MLRSLTIKNFKSIVGLTLELGRFNVFIGENGCGKTNILEALAMAAAVASDRLGNDDLHLRGVRVARPSMVTNAFEHLDAREEVSVAVSFPVPGTPAPSEALYRLAYRDGEWINLQFVDTVARLVNLPGLLDKEHPRLMDLDPSLVNAALSRAIDKVLGVAWRTASEAFSAELKSYAIFAANTLALRGVQTQSRQTPLGLFGEGLDVAIAGLESGVRAKLVEHAKMISWFEDIDIDKDGARRLAGYKPGRSLSDLYFVDRFLSDENQVFSAENANEGILHVLFHLVLFMHPDAPKLVAIDNIETALNPHLLRRIVATLASLAEQNDRQALVTTHNPAALDGLNLYDDEQRLFVVYRNDEGHTLARRIQVKPDATVDGAKLKLSELWMRGMLGGIPTHF